jgi:hypothetical protein
VRQGFGVFCTSICIRSEYVSMGTYENVSSSDVNLVPILSRCGLLENSLYHAIWN